MTIPLRLGFLCFPFLQMDFRATALPVRDLGVIILPSTIIFAAVEINEESGVSPSAIAIRVPRVSVCEFCLRDTFRETFQFHRREIESERRATLMYHSSQSFDVM
jgi:hypothetical protein